MTQFINGIELSRLYYEEVIKPILKISFPEISYSAALLGNGSDVLGYDTPQSMDHDWGPRLTLFLSGKDFENYRNEIDLTLKEQVPGDFYGFKTNFGYHEDGTTVMAENESDLINHKIDIFEIQSYFESILQFNPLIDIRPSVWVSTPENNFLKVTSGCVFYDGLSKLAPIRKKLSYYPHDVWLYILSAQWQRISQEEHFMGRCGQVSDDLGSRLIAARLVRDIMRLCFLMERKYCPYIKWFGSAFSQLECSKELLPILTGVLKAQIWQERERFLSAAYEFIADMHHSLNITIPMPAKVSRFHNRPFMVIHAENYAKAIRDQITDKKVLALPKYLGAFDQFIDSTDALTYQKNLKYLYINIEK